MSPRPIAAAVLLLCAFYAPSCGVAQSSPVPNSSPPKPAVEQSGEAPPANGLNRAGRDGSGLTAGRYLDESRTRLNALESLSARLKQTAEIDGQRFVGEGRLLIARGGRVRMELTPVADRLGGGPALLQVCDGSILHTQYSLGDSLAVTRRNVRTVRTEAEERETGVRLAGDLACGGLAATLASLRTSMSWEEPIKQRIGERPYVVLTGRWTPGAQAVFAEKRKERLDTVGRPGPRPPTGVTVFLEAATLMPHRIRYWTQEADGPRIPTLTLDLANVTLNAPFSSEAFEFELPDGVEVTDLTEPAVVRARAAGAPKPVKPSENDGGNPTDSGATNR
ncbi:MAG: hypothetical protein AAF907_00540 [Planctomycetota bacterium]